MKKCIFLGLMIFLSIFIIHGILPRMALADAPACKGKACIDFGETFSNDTPPMKKSIMGKVKNRRRKEKKNEEKIHPQCQKGIDENDEKLIQKFCEKSPGIGPRNGLPKPPKKKDIMINGKKRGKKITTETVMVFKNAKQRYGHAKKEKWDNLIFKPPKTADLTRKVYKNQTNTKEKHRKKEFFTDVPETYEANNDKDCIDRVTGDHLRNGDCYDSNGNLIKTLAETSGGVSITMVLSSRVILPAP